MKNHHEPDIQHKSIRHPEAGFGWENDCRVPIVEPDAGDDMPPDDPEQLARLETTIHLITRLDAGGTPLQIGQQVLCVAFILGKSSCDTQADLAQRLGVSPGQASKMLAQYRREFFRKPKHPKK